MSQGRGGVAGVKLAAAAFKQTTENANLQQVLLHLLHLPSPPAMHCRPQWSIAFSSAPLAMPSCHSRRFQARGGPNTIEAALAPSPHSRSGYEHGRKACSSSRTASLRVVLCTTSCTASQPFGSCILSSRRHLLRLSQYSPAPSPSRPYSKSGLVLSLPISESFVPMLGGRDASPLTVWACQSYNM